MFDQAISIFTSVEIVVQYFMVEWYARVDVCSVSLFTRITWPFRVVRLAPACRDSLGKIFHGR